MASELWGERYDELATCLGNEAPSAALVLISSTVNVDEVYRMGHSDLETLVGQGGSAGGHGPEIARSVLQLLYEERDGELFSDWPEGPSWLQRMFGPPQRVQLGGTGPQAAWALDVLRATSVMALRHRGADQVSVLPKDLLVCSEGRLVPVREVVATNGPSAARHGILEFPRGTAWGDRRLSRSCRAIVRFAPIALEVDEEFLSQQAILAARSGGALLSGLNGLARQDSESIGWALELLHTWKDGGVAPRHLELGDSSNVTELMAIVVRLSGLFSSVGMSLTELRRIWCDAGDVRDSALGLARALGCTCLVVHADQWSLAIHREDPALVMRQLMAGNLLAAARARHGSPVTDIRPLGNSLYSSEIPAAGVMGGGWRADCAPSPYVESPASTVGLGDTFTAGLLLASALSRAEGTSS